MLSETGPSTSNAEQSSVDDVDTKAIKLLGEGKRNLLVGDAPSAVVSLQEACEILAAKYGEISDQCADPYYHYGNALLELGRMESGVLGNALDGVPEGAATDTDDETTDDTANNVEKANKLEGNERKKVIKQVKEALEMNYEQSVKKSENGDAKVVGVETKESEAADVVGKENGDAEVGKENGEAMVVVDETKQSEAAKVVEKQSDAAKVVEKQSEAAKVVDDQSEAAKVVEKQSEAAEVVGKQNGDAEVVGKQNGDAEVVGKQNGDAEVVGKQNGDAEVVVKQNGDAEVVVKQNGDAEVVGKQNGDAEVIGKENGDKVAKKDDTCSTEQQKQSSKEKVEGKEKDQTEAKDPTKTVEPEQKKKEVKDAGVGTTDMGEVADSATEDDEESEEESANDTADENKEVNPDDVPNFQLAWEMLELARVIFSRKEDKDHKLKVAQVHFKLGELGLETEQYAQSLEDFSICLNIQKSHLEPESRLIAGSHYNLGLAYTFDSKMDKAMENFTAAKKIIEDRISKLEKDVKDKEDKKEENYEEAVNKMKKEITELQELTPDVLAKIEDAKESKSQSVSETSSGFDQPSSSSASSSSAPVTIQVKRKPVAAPVTDISHLVKRKRTDNESSSTVDESADSKRTKQEKGDGDAKQVNGNAEAGKDSKKSDAAMET